MTNRKATFSFQATGTTWQIDIETDLPNDQKKKTEVLAKERIALFERAYSRFRPDSLVAQASRSAGTYLFPPDAPALFSIYKQLYDATGGAFTPLIGQTLVDSGYDPAYSLTPKETITTPGKWEDHITYEAPNLIVKTPTQLDFGAGGKGYIIDLVGEEIEKFGIGAYTIDAGGDIRYRNTGSTPLRVGLENPQDKGEVIGIAEVGNQSICGSSGNRRAWDKYHHIIDPHTLNSPKGILACWVVAESTIIADAISTCLFLVEVEKLDSLFEFDYLILRADYSIRKSEGFHAEMFFA